MGSANLSTKRQRIAELARTRAGTALSTLHHVIDLEWMKEAYRLTRKDGASGIDGVTARDYEANLEANLLDLLERIKSGRYVAPPVRRVYIPKADGSQRPLGIPTLEDKVAQRAIVMVLEPIYEQDFCLVRSASGLGGPLTRLWPRCRRLSWAGAGSAGCWTSTSPNITTPSNIIICGRSSTDESRTASYAG